jgi:hypothetical protein
VDNNGKEYINAGRKVKARPGGTNRAGEKRFLGSQTIASSNIISHFGPKRAYRKLTGQLPEA